MNKNLNYVVIEFPEFATVKSFEHDCTAYYFFKKVSEIIAFDDCTDAKVTDIIWHGKHVRYDGWKPGMLFRYTTPRSKKIVWEGHFHEFDH